MNDDWRLRVEFHEDGVAHALSERLNAAEIEHDLEKSFADRVIVSVDGAEVFAYAGTREQAERAEQLIRKVAAEHEWKLESELKHWHPTAEQWEEPDLPLPQTDADRLAEHAALMERERAESEAQGYPQYEVRIQCRTHEETLALAEQLRSGGLPAVHRWRYLLIGAVNEQSANELAERVRGLAPEGSSVTVEASLPALADGTPGNPFAFLGGLGG
ncbi:MAG: hypothetical protein M3Z06_16240 [Actinomycetota bacterium]|nr:hypothetical protein [Actinomycetota bacterium]